MKFEDVLTMLDACQGVDDLPPIRDGVVELQGVSEGATARIAELEAALADAEAKYTAAAARNWELTQAVTAPVPDPEEGEGDEGEDGPETYDDLFGEDE